MIMYLSPLNQQRWRKFTSNKRGFWAMIIFTVLFIITLGSEFIANDKPIYVHYNNTYYFPIFIMYPETTFGGDFETEADYRDVQVQQLINTKGYMIWPIIRYSYNTVNYNLPTPAPSSPDTENWLGTDDQGRDVLARLIYGFRISILFGLTLTIVSSVIGVIAGAIQGFYGGKIDLIMQRFMEIWSGLPVLYLLIILASLITPNFWWLLGLMLLFSWMSLVSIVRVEFLRARNFYYVQAARALGASNVNIMIKHILPNATIAVMTYMPFILNSSITTLTSLDFLGFGLPPGSPSLGEMLTQGKNNLYAPWLGMTAFFAISMTLTLLVFTGEAVRDALDPRKNTT